MNILLVNFIFWLILLIYSVLKRKSFELFSFFLFIYTFSAVGSIYFFLNIGTILDSDIRAASYLFYVICILIAIFPFYYYANDMTTFKIKEINPLWDKITYILSPFILNAFVELLLMTIKSESTDYGFLYENEVDVLSTQLSWIGKKSVYIVDFFYYLWPILFIVGLIEKKNKVLLSIIGIAILDGFMRSYVAGGRATLVRGFFYCLIVYYIGASSLTGTVKKALKKYFLLFTSVFVLLLFLITQSRFENMNTDNYDLATWVSWYIGEGSIRMSQYTWELSQMTDGDTCFAFFKNILGFDTYLDLQDRRDYYDLKLGIPTNLFYSYIGDFIIDFGKLGAFFANFIFAFLSFCIIRLAKQKNQLSLSIYFYICVMALVIAYGYMYFPYKVTSNIISIIITIFTIHIVNYLGRKEI